MCTCATINCCLSSTCRHVMNLMLQLTSCKARLSVRPSSCTGTAFHLLLLSTDRAVTPWAFPISSRNSLMDADHRSFDPWGPRRHRTRRRQGFGALARPCWDPNPADYLGTRRRPHRAQLDRRPPRQWPAQGGLPPAPALSSFGKPQRRAPRRRLSTRE